MNAYFDFHLHPLFKNHLANYTESFPTDKPFVELIKEVLLSKGLMRMLDDKVLHILQSQCAADYLNTPAANLSVANVSNIEFGFADSQGFFATLMKSKVVSPLDSKALQKVKAGEISYYRILINELDCYRKVVNEAPHTFAFVTRKDPDSLKKLKQKVGFIMSLEGGHNLSMMKIGQDIERDDTSDLPDDDPLTQGFVDESIDTIDPVAVLKTLHAAMWAEDMDLLYLTLTHLSHIQEQHLATHAFGMKMLKHPSFYPHGNGLSRLGRKVIDACYGLTAPGDVTKATPVLIDIKHMSISSRQSFYQYRRDKGYTLPIIATHMGMTGYSLSEWKEAMVRDESRLHFFQGARSVSVTMERAMAGKWGSGINNKFTFNPWSINLMDDDIIEVIQSGGLIGVSLDVRILGFQTKVSLKSRTEPEYLSYADFKALFPLVNIRSLPHESFEEMERVAAESWFVPTKEERHPLCLCFNIIHIHYVGSVTPGIKNPLKNVCIGSDFDGLIDPLKICRDSRKMPDLEANLLRWLPVAARAYQKENGGPDSIYAFTNDLDELESVVRDILYDNGKRFLEKWLKGWK